jgi:putative ABC transport system permease protein
MRKNEVLTAFFIAKKNIIKNRKSLLFTVFIISLGFISSIIIYGVLESGAVVMQENFIETNLGHIVLEPYEIGEKINNVESTIKNIATLPHIVGVTKITKKSARLYDSKGNYIDNEIYIVDPQEFSKVSVIDNIIKQGSWLNKGEKDKIVWGCMNIKDCNAIKAFDTLDLDVGKPIRVVSNGYPESNLKLAGIYDHKFIQVEFNSYINEETAKNIFPDYNSSSANQIILLLTDRDYTEKTLRELSLMNLDLKIVGWKEKSSKYSSIFGSFSIIGDLSFLIGVIISAISIYIVLYVNILNKKNQIGIIRAMGIRSRVISLSYIILSLFLGIVGSILGVSLTLLLIRYFYFNPLQTGIGDLVPNASPDIFAVVSISVILASVISGYIVSKKIIKSNIIESIYNG